MYITFQNIHTKIIKHILIKKKLVNSKVAYDTNFFVKLYRLS